MNLLFNVAMNEDCSFQSAVISTPDFTWKHTLYKEGCGCTSGMFLLVRIDWSHLPWAISTIIWCWTKFFMRRTCIYKWNHNQRVPSYILSERTLYYALILDETWNNLLWTFCITLILFFQNYTQTCLIHVQYMIWRCKMYMINVWESTCIITMICAIQLMQTKYELMKLEKMFLIS